MAKAFNTAAGAILLGAMGCAAQPDDQATINVLGINGRADDDLAVVVEREAGEAENPIQFTEVKDADVSVAEQTVTSLRGDLSLVTLSLLPDVGGDFTIAAPIHSDSLPRMGEDGRFVAVSTEDLAYPDSDIACAVFRAEHLGEPFASQSSDDSKLLELGNSFPLPHVDSIVDAQGELAAGGFDFSKVALFDLSGTAGGHLVLECQVNGDTQRTTVEHGAGDDDDSDGGDGDLPPSGGR